MTHLFIQNAFHYAFMSFGLFIVFKSVLIIHEITASFTDSLNSIMGP